MTAPPAVFKVPGRNNGRPWAFSGKYKPLSRPFPLTAPTSASSPCPRSGPSKMTASHRRSSPPFANNANPAPHSPDPSTTPVARILHYRNHRRPRRFLPDIGHNTRIRGLPPAPALTRSPGLQLLLPRPTLRHRILNRHPRGNVVTPSSGPAPAISAPDTAPTTSAAFFACTASTPVTIIVPNRRTPSVRSVGPTAVGTISGRSRDPRIHQHLFPRQASSTPHCSPAPRSIPAVASSHPRNSPRKSAPPAATNDASTLFTTIAREIPTRRRSTHSTSGTYNTTITHTAGPGNAIAAPGMSLRCVRLSTPYPVRHERRYRCEYCRGAVPNKFERKLHEGQHHDKRDHRKRDQPRHDAIKRHLLKVEQHQRH